MRWLAIGIIVLMLPAIPANSANLAVRQIASRLPCVDWSDGAPYGYLRLFNKCGTCMAAWIHWSNGTNVKENLGAYGTADTPILMQQGTAKIFKEGKC